MDPSYNNSFDSFQNMSGGVISSVPSADGERKVRKGLIIVGAVLIVAVIALVVWYLVSGGVTPLSDAETRAAKKNAEYGEMMGLITKGEGFTIEQPEGDNEENEASEEAEALAEAKAEGYNFFYDAEDAEETEEELGGDSGEELEEDSGDEAIDYKYDFIYAIDIYGENYGWVEGYYNEIEEKIAKFEEASGGQVSEAALSEFKGVMTVLRNAVDYSTTAWNLETMMVTDGVEAARNYINNQVKCEGELEDICAAEAKYYEAAVNLYEKYNTQSCAVVDEELIFYDDDCMLMVLGEEVYEQQMGEILNEDVSEQEFLDFKSLKKLDEAVRASLTKMAEEILSA